MQVKHDMRPYPREQVIAKKLTVIADKGLEFLVQVNIRIWDWKQHYELKSFVLFSADNLPKGKVKEESPEKKGIREMWVLETEEIKQLTFT